MLAFTAPDTISQRVAALRAFNRFYTRRIGVVSEGMHETPHSLPEARVLYELGLQPVVEVADLRRELDIDAGHLSRLLARMDAKGLLTRERSESDGRRQRVRMTEAGAAARAVLDERSATENGRLLEDLDAQGQRRLLDAMRTIRELLGDAAETPAIVLRGAEPGDLGWIVERHGALYAEEFGWWDARFEAMVARIVSDYVDDHDEAREAVWIAEVSGRRAGSIMCIDHGDGVAQLRCLLVEPSARGLGLGSRLVDECLRFARRAGYREMRLWTNSVLDGARRIYERAGFTLVEEEEHEDGFAPDRVFQTWGRTL
jgi:DNA-binding MarR family transcriptional regulator/N-acetylglutamate synthase-like GNAT family acetyltransferase